MRNFTKTLLFLALLAVPWLAGAQSHTVTFGNWSGTLTTTYTGPGFSARFSWTQILYTSDDMGPDSGWVRSIVLDNRSTASGAFDSLKVWMGYTTLTTLSPASSSNWVPMADLTQVFAAYRDTIPAIVGPLQIDLQQPFFYNGTGNIVVVVSKSAPAASTNTKFGYTSVTGAAKYYNGTTATYCNLPATAAGTASTSKLNIKFLMTEDTTDIFCPDIENFHVSNITPNSVTLAWDSCDVNDFQIGYAVKNSTNPDPSVDDIIPLTITTNTHIFTGLNEGTAYRFFIRHTCGSGTTNWQSIDQSTPALPGTVPFSADFDDVDNDGVWTAVNGLNGWYIDSLDGNRKLFVSNDNGNTNSYTITQYNLSWIYRDLTLPAGGYSISFDWQAQGESTWDYMRLMLIPDSVTLTNDHTDFFTSSSTFSNTIPDGWINCADSTPTRHFLNLSNGLRHHESEFILPTSGTYHFAILWANDGSGGTQPPASIDNINIEASDCYGPSFVTVDTTSITSTSASISVTHAGGASSFLVAYHRVGSSHFDTVQIGTTYSFSDLEPGSTYELFVSTLCSDDTSRSQAIMTFATACGTLSLPHIFDAEYAWEGTTSAPQLHCWQLHNYGTSSYNWRYSTTSTGIHSGDYAFYYYGIASSAATYTWSDWMITPVLDLNGGDELTFFMKTSSSTATALYHGRFSIYATDDDEETSTDTADFHRLTLSGDVVDNRVDITGNTWQQLTIKLPDDLDGLHRLAFVIDTQSYSFYLDDIMLQPHNSCTAPYDIVINAVTSEQVSLSWSDSNASNSGYIVNVWPEGAGASDTITENTTDTTATVYNLNANTAYYVSVQTDCGSNTSNISFPVEFRTACIPIVEDSLPYVEDFENYGTGSAEQISPCWSKYYSNGTTYPYPYATNAISGTRSLYFYGYRSSATLGYYSYAVMPYFENDLNELILEFDVRRYSTTTSTYHSILMVGIMSVADDISSFDTLAVYDLTNEPSLTIQHKRLSLESYEGTGRIAFLCPTPETSSHYNYFYLDNVTVDLLPSCVWPENVTVDSIHSDEIFLSWTGSATSYEVQASTDPTFPDSTTTSNIVYGNDGSIDNLVQYTQYYLRLRALCGSEQSYWSETVDARTLIDCGENNVNILDTIGDGTSASAYYAFAIYSTTSPYGYSYAIFTAQELNDMGLQTNNRINAISLQAGSTAGTIRNGKVYMKEVDQDIFGSTTDTIPRDSMTLVYSGDITTTANQWCDIVLDSAFQYSGNSNIAILFYRDTTATASVNFRYTTQGTNNYRTLYRYKSSATATESGSRATNRLNMAFNICTEVPTCPRPTDVTLTSVSDTAVTLTWNGEATQYEVLVTTSSIDPETSSLTGITFYQDSVTVDTLQPNTTYYYYVRANCGGIGNSPWTVEGTFRTACAPMALPYSEDFESYSTGSTASISPCWRKGTSSTTAYPYPSSTSTYLIQGNRYLYMYAYRSSTTGYYSYAALPLMQDSVQALQLSFSMRRYATLPSTTYNYTSRVVVGVMTDPDDIATFSPVDTIDMVNEAAYALGNYEVLFNNYHGDGQYIAIYDEVPPLGNASTSAYSYVYLDNVVVDYIPTCPRVTGVTIDSVFTTEAYIHWNAASNNLYDIEYGPTGFTQGTGTVMSTTNNYATITGLQPSTTYDIYVRNICSATDTGIWSFVTTFATDCGKYSLPIFLDPEDYTTGSSAPLPLCWTRTNDATGTYNYYPYVTTSSTNTHTGTKVFYWYMYNTSSYADVASLASPEIDTANFPMNQVEVIFFAKYGTNANSVIVGVMTNPADASTFQPVDTVHLTSVVTEYNVPLSNFNGNGAHIALRVTKQTSYSYVYVDDITIRKIAPCPRSYDLSTTAATQNSATLEWTDTIGSSSWAVRYALYGDTNWTVVTANNNPYTLTGLTPSTRYQYQVAPYCTSGVLSEWSDETAVFRTTQVPASIPYNYNFEDATEWNNWQTLSNDAVNYYRGIVANGNTTNTLYISADNGATNSNGSMAYHNVVAFRDIDFGTDTAGYELNFDARFYGATAGFYNGLVVFAVNPSLDYEASSASIQTPWGSINDMDWIGYVRTDSVWNHNTMALDGMTGVQRLVFYYFNSSTTEANQPITPLAIDNITIAPQACERPYNLTVDTTTENSATVHWTGDPTANYQLTYRVQGTSYTTNVFHDVQGNSFTIPNLPSSTDFYWWVRKICTLTTTDTNISDWSLNGAFSTKCGAFNVVDTLREDFENITGVAYSSTAGTVPNCWTAFQTGTNGVAPHVTNGSTYSYCINGTNALSFHATGATSTTYGEQYVALPYIMQPTNSLTLAYWFCTESSSSGTLYVGYLTGDDFVNDFVALKDVPASSQTYHSGNGLQSTQGIRDTVYFDTVPSGNYRIAFKWVSPTSTLWSASIDDIAVWSNAPFCAEPTASVSDIDYNQATLNFSSTATEYEVNIKLATEANFDDNNDVLVSGNSYTFTNLQPSTVYQYRVRALCDIASDLVSTWTTGNFTTDSLPCMIPSDFHTTTVGYTTATFEWTANGIENQWAIHVWDNNGSNEVEVSSNPATVTGLLANHTYNAAVKAVCGNGAAESEYSDTIQFTTSACAQVTGVTATNVTATSATLSWNPTGAANYRIEYGEIGFSQGDGISVDVTGTTYTLTGLSSETQYTAYVLAVCETGVEGDWSAAVNFETQTEGISTVDGGINLAIYPNPTSDATTITLSGVNGEVSIVIVDMNGRIVKSDTMSCEGDCTKRMEVSGLAQGAYFVRVSGDGVSQVKKLVVK